MDRTDDLWTAIRRVLPDAEELAAAVAAELGEPLDDVRPSVLIGTIALNGQLGPEAAATAAIEAELGRLQSVKGTRPPGRPIAADSLDDLLAETRALEVEGSLDLETIVAIQRASGAIAARTDRPVVVLLHRYAVTRRLIWEHCVAAMQAGRLDPGLLAAFGRFLLLWNELTSLAVTDGYRTAERDILARAVEARRGALQELLGVVADDAASEARLRRVAVRHGLNPDRAYRLVAIAPRPESDPIPERPGIGEEELEVLAGRIGHLLGSTAPGAEGVGAGSGCRPCCRSWGASPSSPVRTGPGCHACRPSSTASSAASPRPAVQGRAREEARSRRAGGLGGGRLTGDRRCWFARRDVCRPRRRHAHRPSARPAWLDPGP